MPADSPSLQAILLGPRSVWPDSRVLSDGGIGLHVLLDTVKRGQLLHLQTRAGLLSQKLWSLLLSAIPLGTFTLDWCGVR